MDTSSTLELVSRLFTILILGLAGYQLSKRFSPPQTIVGWLGLILAILVASTIGVSLRIVSIFGANLYMNSVLEGTGIGLLVGFVVRAWKTPMDAAKKAAR